MWSKLKKALFGKRLEKRLLRAISEPNHPLRFVVTDDPEHDFDLVLEAWREEQLVAILRNKGDWIQTFFSQNGSIDLPWAQLEEMFWRGRDFQAESLGKLDSTKLCLSAQRALVGAISHNVLGIYIDPDAAGEMVAFFDGAATDTEREELDAATTEIVADYRFPPPRVDLRVVENAQQPLQGTSSGIWVFLRAGVAVVGGRV